MNKRQMRCAEVKEAGSSGGGIPRCQGNRSLMTSDNGAGKWVGCLKTTSGFLPVVNIPRSDF